MGLEYTWYSVLQYFYAYTLVCDFTCGTIVLLQRAICLQVLYCAPNTVPFVIFSFSAYAMYNVQVPCTLYRRIRQILHAFLFVKKPPDVCR
jgi:hypothetical protein